MNFIDKYLDSYSTSLIINTYYKKDRNVYKTFNKYGYAEVVPNKIEVNDNTEYDIASITKFLTATLVYRTIELNKLKLEDKIYEIDNRFINLKNITIKTLLSHKTNIWTKKHLTEAKNKEEMVDLLYNSYVKDEQKIYVDSHYMILGLILEKLWNKSLRKLYKEMIFEPLNLKSAGFKSNNAASNNYEIVNGEVIANIEKGTVHDSKAKKADEFGFTLGHAGIFINSKDMMTFLISFIDGKEKILKNSTIDMMMKNDGEKNNERTFYNLCSLRYKYSLGAKCDVPINSSENSVAYSGFTGPSFMIDFDKKIIISIMANICHNSERNRKSTIRKELLNEIYDYIIKNS